MSKTTKEIADGILEFLKKNNLESELPQLIEYLEGSSAKDDAYVYAPRNLNASEKKDLQKLFVNLTGETPHKIVFYEDKTLIDGLKIMYKDKMWDFSVKGQIDKIAKS
jgi:F0F1-type ATP synthase delta subunit